MLPVMSPVERCECDSKVWKLKNQGVNNKDRTHIYGSVSTLFRMQLHANRMHIRADNIIGLA